MFPWKKLANFGNDQLSSDGYLQSVANMEPDRVWYVDSSLGNDGDVRDGHSWDDSLLTITEAVSRAAAQDVIILRGEFDESAAVTISKELKIYGQNQSENGYPTMIYNSAAHELFIIKANNVVIDSIGFVQTQAEEAIKIGDTAGQAYYKLFINNCKFDLYGTGTYAIASGDTADAPDIHINKCLFRSCATACIQGNWTRGRVSNCIMHVDAGTIGYEHIPTTSSRPDTILDNNRIIGANSTDTGIKITNTPDAGTLIAYGNYVFNCATTITQAANNVAVQMNYTNDAAGGALIDPIA